MSVGGSNAFVLDLECNELYPLQTKTWTICIKKVGSNDRLKLNPFKSTKERVKEEILNFLFKDGTPTIVGHNYLGFDGWVLWKDFDLDFSVGKDTLCGRSVFYFDTLYASQYLLPDREGGHSLKSWGVRVGDNKIDYYNLAVEKGVIPKGSPEGTEFSVWSSDMDIYCEKDTDVTEKVYLLLSRQLDDEKSHQAFRLGQKTFFLMAAQSFTGFEFDKGKAVALKARIEQMILDLKNEVEPELPKRPLKKSEEDFYRMPAKPFLQGGGLSATMMNFIVKHSAEIISGTQIKAYGVVIDIEPHKAVMSELPMSLQDQNAMKDYFLSIGWKPSMWNFKKGKDGRPVRDEKGKLVQTSPKIQEAGKICENLLELDGELPQKIVRFLSLRNRLGILTGWLENKRLAWDGRLTTGSSGIASTHRQKHTVVVNVPKAQDDVLLGKEFRELFTVQSGNKLIGCDQAALEARCEAHYVFEYDKEAANELISGDVHSKNAKAFYPTETAAFDIKSPDFNKEDVGFKKYRSFSKNGKYCLSYGGSPTKLAQTLKQPEKRGKVLFDAFWAANDGLKKFKDKLEYTWEREGGKIWITAIDGRRLHSRSKHSLVNLCFQSTGAIIVDYALCLFDIKMGTLRLDNMGRPYYLYKGKLVRRVQYFHDEFGCEVDSEIAEEVAKIMEWCMAEAGVRLKLNVPLVGEAKIGLNWKETH